MMLNDRSSAAVAARNPPLRPSRASWSGPARRAEELERILTIAARTPDHGKLSPWRFVIVADDQRDALADAAPRARSPSRTRRDRRPITRRREQFAHQRGALVVLDLRPGPGPQDPGVGAATVVRRGGDEPAARRPCARLCRRLGDRLAGLFASGSAPPSASPASGSPASSSSAIRAASWRSGRAPALATRCRAAGRRPQDALNLDLFARCCIITA